MAFCTKCGANLPENASFCGICGAPINKPAPAPQANQYQQQPSRQAGYNQYQQPQQQYQQPQQQYQYPPQQYQQPRYPQQQYQQPRQGYGNDYGWDPPAQRKKPVRHVGFLRFLSFLMAIGMIVAAIGFGCQLYFDRTYKSIGDTFVDLIKEEAGKQLEEEKKDAEKYGYTLSDSTIKEYEQRGKTAESINQDIFQKYSSDIKGVLAAVIREDPAGLKKAVKAYAVNTLKDAPSYGLFLKNAGYPNYDSSFEAAVNAIPTFYSDNKSEVDGIMDDLLGDISNSSIRQPLRKVGKVCSEEFGFRWFMLQIGVRGTLVMIIGGALFLLSLILWLALRGPSAGAAHTGFAAALIIGLILAGGIIAACQFLVKPIVFEEIRDLIKVEQANPDWADSVKDLVSDARAAWDKQQSRLQELYTKLISQIIY